MNNLLRKANTMDFLKDGIKIVGFVIVCVKQCLKVNALMVVVAAWYVVSKMALDPDLIVWAVVGYAFLGGSWDTLKKGLTEGIGEIDKAVKENSKEKEE